MVAERGLDFGRTERSAAAVDAALVARGVSLVRRAIIAAFVLHPRAGVEVEQDPETGDDRTERWLEMSLEALAGWLRSCWGPAAGMTLDRSTVRKALQWWIGEGVCAVCSAGSVRRIWLDVNRLREWGERVPERAEGPIYQASKRGVARCGPVWPGVAGCGPVWPGVARAPYKELEEEELESSSSDSECAIPEAGQTPPAAELVAPVVVEAVRSLPELPAAVWSGSEAGARKALAAWWDEHGLTERLGPAGRAVRHVLAGLIDVSRSRDAPVRYFRACLARGVQAWIPEAGRAWLERREAVYTR